MRNMPRVRRVIAVIALLGLVAAGAASADHQEPQKRLTKADNARARAMLLKRSDLPGFTVRAGSADEPHVSCSPAVGESDLTLTGEARSKTFQSGPVVVGSASQVYESVADASASWRRGAGAAGLACIEAQYRAALGAQGARLQSVRRLAFPNVADRTAAFRITASLDTPQGTVPATEDVVVLMHRRAHAAFVVGAALVKPTKAGEVRLARVVAGRMRTAMRGA
jgi:hypothetical protein